MVLRPLAIIDACAGIGQLGQAVQRGLSHFGLDGRCVLHIERDAAAASMLVARMEAQELDRAFIWSDLGTFDGRPSLRRVAGFCAGLPCPAFSTAGKRVGNFDPRAWGEGFDPDKMETWGPIPHSIRIISECRPGFVFLENVPGFLRSGAFEPVGRELCGLGYTRQAAIFVSAEDVGYPHCRERAFVLVVDDAAVSRWRGQRDESGWSPSGDAIGRTGEELADGHDPECSGQRLQLQQRRSRQAGFESSGSGEIVAHCNSDERAERGQAAGRGSNVGATHDRRPERSRESMANTECERQPEHIWRKWARQQPDAPNGGEKLAKCTGGRRRTDGIASGSDRQPERSNQFVPAGVGLADSSGARREGPERPRPLQQSPAAASESVTECRDAVGDSEYTEPGAGISNVEKDSRSGRGRSSNYVDVLPLYPPARGTDLAAVARAIAEAAEIDRGEHVQPDSRGSASRRATAAACRLARGIWRDWETVARLDPARMPAIESGLQFLVDGDTYSAADLLRLSGNCVVEDAATIAFVELWRELIGGE